MITPKYGRDIVAGDKLIIAQGATVPFGVPLQPVEVMMRGFRRPSGKWPLATKKCYPDSEEITEYEVCGGELYFVWSGELPPPPPKERTGL
jgi:hypothetical protein